MKNRVSKNPAVSLYIHIPFCHNRCSFCSFVVAIGKQNHIDAYLEALAKEARKYKGVSLETIYIGGGTPSFLDTAQLKRLVEIVKNNFHFKTNAEFTIEANPENIDLQKARLLYDMGVNRISLGVQSLNDKYLKFLGRPHDSQGALKSYQCLRKAGFSNISLDLMFSFPHQTTAEIEKDVEGLTSLGSEHLSLYTLTIEEGSKFHKLNVELENDHLRSQQYVRVTELLEEKGFLQYEISNFAKPQKESRHNCVYWQGGEYIGLGIGAHSHLEGRRFWNTPNLTQYIAKITEGVSPVLDSEQLDLPARFMETFLFGLRMNCGVHVSGLEERFSYALPLEKRKLIDEFISDGFLTRRNNILQTTLKGRLVLDEISARLI